MSLTFISPENPAPGNIIIPLFNVPNVTVMSDFTAMPNILPLEASTPEEISTDTIYDLLSFIFSIISLYPPVISLDRPIPKIASIIISYSLSSIFVTKDISNFFAIPSCFLISSLACSIFPTSFISVSIPLCISILATATPSAPLFPIPATTSTFISSFLLLIDFNFPIIFF